MNVVEAWAPVKGATFQATAKSAGRVRVVGMADESPSGPLARKLGIKAGHPTPEIP